MKIAIGSDHAALDLKSTIVEHLKESGTDVTDLGTHTAESCDYPDIAKLVCEKVAAGEYQYGILVCGTGIGMSIAANKVKGIRAALCHDTFSASMAKQHNNSNILCMGARVVGSGLALAIVDEWISQEFVGGRHAIRVEKLENI